MTLQKFDMHFSKIQKENLNRIDMTHIFKINEKKKEVKNKWIYFHVSRKI